MRELVESAHERRLRDTEARNAPIIVVATVIGNLVWWGLDAWLYAGDQLRNVTLARLGVVELAAVVSLCLLWAGRSREAWVLTTWALQVGGALIVVAGDGALDPYISGVFFVFVAPSLVVPVLPRIHVVGHGLAVLVLALGVALRHPNDPVAPLVQQVFVLLWMSAFVWVGLTLLDRQIRSELRAQVELEATNTELAAARDAALASEKAKSAFLANMSHELRTPLNAVIGYAEMVQEEAEDAMPEAVEDLERIGGAAKYLLRLIDDVLDLSKIASGKLEVRPTTSDLSGLVGDLREMAEALCARKRNTLAVEGVDVEVLAWADPLRTRQILLNLISNAAKFTVSGTVTITVRGEAGAALVTVRDTGRGMDADQLAKLFQPFQQVHRTDHEALGGTGLGLALSRDLARAMGGDLTAASKVGEGSAFTLRLRRG
ncbi:MAG: HAMP domain-containing histidine kinase [Myxococcales bacterium]|nr:HAMP domain-containing histidine kinase [Myxococcales bacterium]